MYILFCQINEEARISHRSQVLIEEKITIKKEAIEVKLKKGKELEEVIKQVDNCQKKKKKKKNKKRMRKIRRRQDI